MPNTKVVGIIFPYILTPIPNLYDHSFPRYGQITFLTFRRPTTLTFDLKFWKYLSVTVYPYVICMPSFIMIGWEMAELLHFEILRKHGQTNTHTHTNKQTHRHGHYNTSPSPYGGRGKYPVLCDNGCPWLHYKPYLIYCIAIFIYLTSRWFFDVYIISSLCQTIGSDATYDEVFNIKVFFINTIYEYIYNKGCPMHATEHMVIQSYRGLI